ncbi:MAG: hypothetical protein PCFJNLEI_02747 [Verrucomicrobiae bacterium]|nr:hypothetical protein [Verrucomicrobiae bacterium]
MNLPILLAVGFLFLKTGEKFATQEAAGPTVAELTQQLGGDFEPRIFNDPAKAIEYVAKSKPAAGIVTPGFYITYAKALGMTPLLEVKRHKIPVERYVLVTKQATELTAIKSVATALAAEQMYVMRVVLQNKLGEELRLQPTLDEEGAVFDLVEGGKSAADAVLLEEAAWEVLRADPELGAQVKAAFTSAELPGNLVVTFGGRADSAKLVESLKTTPPAILESIRVEVFSDIAAERLKRAEELFHAK